MSFYRSFYSLNLSTVFKTAFLFNESKFSVVNCLQRHYILQYLYCGALYNQWKSKNALFYWRNGATTLSIKGSLETINIHNTHHKMPQHNNVSGVKLSVAFHVLLCWMSLCWVSLYWMQLCWVSWGQTRHAGSGISIYWVSLWWMSRRHPWWVDQLVNLVCQPTNPSFHGHE